MYICTYVEVPDGRAYLPVIYVGKYLLEQVAGLPGHIHYACTI